MPTYYTVPLRSFRIEVVLLLLALFWLVLDRDTVRIQRGSGGQIYPQK